LLPLSLALALCGFAILLLLPTLLELKRPRDKGPRRVAESTIEFDRKNIAKMGADTLRVIGDVEFPVGAEARENIVVEGSLVIGDRCHFQGTIKASGDIDVGSEVLIEGNLVTEGSVNIGKDTIINGAVNAEGSVRLGENTSIGLALISGGNVELHKDARVFKNIFSHGHIHALWTSEEEMQQTV